MKTALMTMLCVCAVVAGATEPGPHPVLWKLKGEIEAALGELKPKPTVSFPHGSLNVRFRTRHYTVHPKNKAGRISEETIQVEGPSDDGFFLRAHLQPKGTVNQAEVPQVWRETYWSTFLNVYEVKGSDKQIYMALSFSPWTDEEILKRIKEIAEQLSPPYSEPAPERGSGKGDS
jgi:hypothetical protein